MVLRIDPFREIDRLAASMFAAAGGHAPMAMPLDVYRTGDHYVIHCELPGIDPGTVDVSVERSTLTITAERTAFTGEGVQWLLNERVAGSFRRQLTLGDGLDVDRIEATYSDGVLTLSIPVAEQARPRRIAINRSTTSKQIEGSVKG